MLTWHFEALALLCREVSSQFARFDRICDWSGVLVVTDWVRKWQQRPKALPLGPLSPALIKPIEGDVGVFPGPLISGHGGLGSFGIAFLF